MYDYMVGKGGGGEEWVEICQSQPFSGRCILHSATEQVNAFALQNCPDNQ